MISSILSAAPLTGRWVMLGCEAEGEAPPRGVVPAETSVAVVTETDDGTDNPTLTLTLVVPSRVGDASISEPKRSST